MRKSPIYCFCRKVNSMRVKALMDYLESTDNLSEIDKAIRAIQEYLIGDYWESKNTRLKEWNPDRPELYYLVVFIFSIVLGGEQTYQALIGSIVNKINVSTVLDRIKIAAEVIGILHNTGLITIEKEGQIFWITSEWEVGITLPSDSEKHIPYNKPVPVDYNCLLGNYLKQHDMQIRKSTLNILNSTALSLNKRVIDSVQEKPKNMDEMTQEQLDDWNTFVSQSKKVYQYILDTGNRFYLQHQYDTRGRIYCAGYYINYQGASYKKGIIELYNKEIVNL